MPRKKKAPELTFQRHIAEQADEMLKSSYNLEFLGLRRAVKERLIHARTCSQPQRGFVKQPRVAARPLPWITETQAINPNGVASKTGSQGSVVAATLG